MTTPNPTGSIPKAARIGPTDPRYRAVLEKRFNKRFSAQPEYVCLVSSTNEVAAAVEDAVREGRRLVVTSGGHCLEGFVSDPDVRVILDVSPMKRIEYDAQRRAMVVEAGASVGDAFRALAERWGVVVPLGEYPGVGIGGHVAGGAFGFLCRQLGLAADYLYALELVSVDADGRARIVVATREANDPNRELWWAHTGAGGGNFGIVTRYWFRSRETSSDADDPARILPRAPESVTTFTAEWDWQAIDERSFLRLVQNHGTWCEQHSADGGANASLWTLLEIHRQQFGKIFVRGISTASATDAERQIDDHLASVSVGLAAPRLRAPECLSWLDFALNPFPDLFGMPPGGVRMKAKDALLKRRLTDRQIAVVHEYLTRADFDVMGGMFGLATYGGRVNTVAPDATASVHRGSILDMACSAGWLDPQADEEHVRWARTFYRDLFAESGGVPVPGDAVEGAMINHPDVDLADPAWNTSGVPWHTLYYGANYPRLQQIKARWDPRNIFCHPLSIRA